MPSKAQTIRMRGQYIYIPADSKERFLIAPSPPGSYFDNHGIRRAGISNLTKGYRVERQNIFTHLVLYTLKGSGHLQIKGKPPRTLEKNDVFITPYTSEYNYWTDRRWDIMWVHLNPDMKWDNLIGTVPHIQKAAWMDELEREMEAYLGEVNRRRADSDSVLHSYVNLIVLYLQRELAPNNTQIADSRRVLEKIWNEVQLHIDRKWQVEDLSKLAHMSRSTFQRIVKEHTGCSPMQVVNTMKMENASAMLLYTDYTLDTISRLVGYEDQFSFSKAFKRYAGVSPLHFKLRNDHEIIPQP